MWYNKSVIIEVLKKVLHNNNCDRNLGHCELDSAAVRAAGGRRGRDNRHLGLWLSFLPSVRLPSVSLRIAIPSRPASVRSPSHLALPDCSLPSYFSSLFYFIFRHVHGHDHGHDPGTATVNKTWDTVWHPSSHRFTTKKETENSKQSKSGCWDATRERGWECLQQ